MGYNTDFDGVVTIEPPLNFTEIEYLKKFADTRRMNRKNGPYYVGGTGMCGQGADADIIDNNSPDPSQPGLWCKWEPVDIQTDDDGVQTCSTIGWNYCEKFYDGTEWMRYLIDHFIGENPLAKLNQPEHFGFLQGHVCNGDIYADGEESGDNWKIEVRDGIVTEKQGTVSYD